MNLKDLKRFSTIMLAMGEAFDKDISEVKIELYFRLLKDISLDKLEAAALKLIATKTISTYPTIAEIRNQVSQTPEQKAIKAWNEIINASPLDMNPEFEDLLIPIVLDRAFGGYIEFMKLNREREISDRRHFIESYKVYAQEIELKRLLKIWKKMPILKERGG